LFLTQIIVLSIIQGLTEFLPISSSGHLVLFPHFLGWKDQGIEMDVAVHVGTLGAVLLYFWKDVLSMIGGAFSLIRGKVTPGGQLFIFLCIGTIPAIIFGLILSSYGMDKLRSPIVIAWTMIIYGVVMYAVDKACEQVKSIKHVTGLSAFVIGCAQALALIPGTSRSGACMTMMRLYGFKRPDAAKFSFLLSIPAITAAAGLTGFKMVKAGRFWDASSDMAIAACIALVAGFLAINFMLTWLRSRDFTPFVIYRLVLGGIILLWFQYL